MIVNSSPLLTVDLQHPIADEDWSEVAAYLRWLAKKIDAGHYRTINQFCMHEPVRL